MGAIIIRVPVPEPESPMTVPDSLYRAIQERIDAGEDETQISAWLLSEHPEYRLNPAHSLFDLIHRDTRYWELRQILQVPSPINTISSKMGLSENEIEHLVSVASFSEADGIRLLDARYHTFLRATESVFVTLQPSKKRSTERVYSMALNSLSISSKSSGVAPTSGKERTLR